MRSPIRRSISRRNFLKGVTGASVALADSLAAAQGLNSATPYAFNKLAARRTLQQVTVPPDNAIELAGGNLLVTADGRYLITH